MKKNGKEKFNLDNGSLYMEQNFMAGVTDDLIRDKSNESQETKQIEEVEQTKVKRGRPKTTRVAIKGSQKGLKEGYTRKTFILRDELISDLDNLAWYERTTIQEITNQMLEDYLKEHITDEMRKEFERR